MSYEYWIIIVYRVTQAGIVPNAGIRDFYSINEAGNCFEWWDTTVVSSTTTVVRSREPANTR